MKIEAPEAALALFREIAKEEFITVQEIGVEQEGFDRNIREIGLDPAEYPIRAVYIRGQWSGSTQHEFYTRVAVLSLQVLRSINEPNLAGTVYLHTMSPEEIVEMPLLGGTSNIQFIDSRMYDTIVVIYRLCPTPQAARFGDIWMAARFILIHGADGIGVASNYVDAAVAKTLFSVYMTNGTELVQLAAGYPPRDIAVRRLVSLYLEGHKH